MRQSSHENYGCEQNMINELLHELTQQGHQTVDLPAGDVKHELVDMIGAAKRQLIMGEQRLQLSRSAQDVIEDVRERIEQINLILQTNG